METPLVLAFLVCEQILTDQRTGRRSLINIFDQIYGPTFPFVLPISAVYASLSNGKGKLNCEMRCARENELEPVLSMSGPLEFPDPIARVDLVYELNNVIFKEPGAYSFMLFCEGEILVERRVQLVHAPQPPHFPLPPNFPFPTAFPFPPNFPQPPGPGPDPGPSEN